MVVVEWIRGILGLWYVWVVLGVFGAIMIYIAGLWVILYQVGVEGGLPLENLTITKTANTVLNGWYSTAFGLLGFITIISFIVYIITSSMRRRVDEWEEIPLY